MLPELIIKLSKDPFNSDLNFDVAEQYLINNQTASAVSFYLRCVEYGPEKSPKCYSALLRMAGCFEDQNGREYSVSNCLLQALAYDDTRPEAYWLLSRYYERDGKWQESYTFATMGIGWVTDNDALPTDLGFHPRVSLQFQKAVAAWWIGRKDESLELFNWLKTLDIPQHYKDAIEFNLNKLGA